MPSENTKQLIARVARREFARHGFGGARTARIARDAGVNKQLLFYYFGSKAGLYRAVIAEADDALRRAAVPPASPSQGAERLRRSLSELFGTMVGEPELTRLILQASPAGPLPLGDVLEQLEAVVSEGQGTGHFRDDVDPGLAARQALTLVLGYLAIEGALEPEPPGPSGRSRWIDGAADLLVRSLSW